MTVHQATVTGVGHDPMGLFRDTLEEQYQRHIDRLAELTIRSRRPGRGGHGEQTLAAEIAAHRQAVADTAQALRRMADGTYGRCDRCTGRIPVERLAALPHTRLCGPCEVPAAVDRPAPYRAGAGQATPATMDGRRR